MREITQPIYRCEIDTGLVTHTLCEVRRLEAVREYDCTLVTGSMMRHMVDMLNEAHDLLFKQNPRLKKDFKHKCELMPLPGWPGDYTVKLSERNYCAEVRFKVQSFILDYTKEEDVKPIQIP